MRGVLGVPRFVAIPAIVGDDNEEVGAGQSMLAG
jgi:hypothetical protein